LRTSALTTAGSMFAMLSARRTIPTASRLAEFNSFISLISFLWLLL